jgi:hypothetical protein
MCFIPLCYVCTKHRPINIRETPLVYCSYMFRLMLRHHQAVQDFKKDNINTNMQVVLLQTGNSILSQSLYSKLIHIMIILWKHESVVMACHICYGINCLQPRAFQYIKNIMRFKKNRKELEMQLDFNPHGSQLLITEQKRHAISDYVSQKNLILIYLNTITVTKLTRHILIILPMQLYFSLYTIMYSPRMSRNM